MVSADGSYGALTQMAVTQFQKRNGLTAPEDRNRSLARRTMLLSVMGMMADRAAAAATANAADID